MKRYLLFVFLTFLSFSSYSEGNFTDTIVTPSGLKYVCLKKGDGIKPVEGQKVKVHYRGELSNGRVFDTSRGGKPFSFKVGKKHVIPGWDEGIQLMSKGEIGVLIVPAHLAYGKRGVKDPNDDSKYEIPPDAELIFEMELIQYK